MAPGRLPSNMLWCDTRKGHEKYIWYNLPGKRRMFFQDSLNIRMAYSICRKLSTSLKTREWTIFAYKGGHRKRHAAFRGAPFFNVTRGSSVCLGQLHIGKTGKYGLSFPCWNTGKNGSGSLNSRTWEEMKIRHAANLVSVTEQA